LAKLHELVAVNGSTKGQWDRTRGDLMNTFTKKVHLFDEIIQVFTPDDETQPAITETQCTLQTSVRKELGWLSDFARNCIDVQYQIAVGNLTARADLVLPSGLTLLKDIPATALLELENRLEELHGFAFSIPTLDPVKGYVLDPDRSDNTLGQVYKARDVLKVRTKKVTKPLVLYNHTDKHPAQVQAVIEDERIGEIRQTMWSGLITPAEKANIISRVEELQRAVKQSLSRAKDIDIDVKALRIGETVLKYALSL